MTFHNFNSKKTELMDIEQKKNRITHLTLEEVDMLCDNRADEESRIEWLTHISECSYCAELFAHGMEQMVLVPAPRNMKDAILKKSVQIDMKFVKKAKETSKQVQLMIYSLKVGVAVLGTLFMLLYVPVVSSFLPSLQRPYTNKEEYKSSLFNRMQEGSTRINQLINQITNDINLGRE